MAMFDWIKDLKALAAARRANDAATSRLSFADDCEFFKNYVERGVDSRVEPSLSELSLVGGISDTVAEIMERLEGANPSARPSVLAEYGLQTSAVIGLPRLKRMRAATEELRHSLSTAAWICSPEEERQRYATEAGAALQRFLAASH